MRGAGHAVAKHGGPSLPCIWSQMSNRGMDMTSAETRPSDLPNHGGYGN
jgi:hypothetical protein